MMNTDKRDFFKRSDIIDQPAITIGVTDSGLGGLSTTADLMRRLHENCPFSQVRVVFFNALFDNASGYNRLDLASEKIRIFDAALSSMQSRFSPDIVLVACNTLSVLVEQTAFFKTAGVPTLGILDAGLRLMVQALHKTPDARIVLFATRTTVESGEFSRRLQAQGFSADTLIAQACPDLADCIERGMDPVEAEMLITEYVTAATQQLAGADWYASLNCTHFGYAERIWQKVFEKLNLTPLSLLNPNTSMLDFLDDLPTVSSTEPVRVEVISRVEILTQAREAIGDILAPVSLETAAAFRNYTLDENLFSF